MSAQAFHRIPYLPHDNNAPTGGEPSAREKERAGTGFAANIGRHGEGPTELEIAGSETPRARGEEARRRGAASR